MYKDNWGKRAFSLLGGHGNRILGSHKMDGVN
jgi:hypothetical protein